MKKIMLLVISSVCTVLTTEAWSQTGNGRQTDTNSMPEWSSAYLELPRPSTFWTKLTDNVDRSATIASLDRFGDITRLTWIKINDRFNYASLDYFNTSGKEVFEKTAVNGLRETAAHMPITDDWYAWAGSLWKGAIGNTAEEQLGGASVVPTESERTWWQKVKASSGFTGGWRLDDPTLYGSVRFGHWLNNPALIVHGRINYRPLDKTSAELNAIVPMPFGEISGGVSFDLLKLNNQSMTAYARISHGLLHSNAIFWFVGLSYDQRNRNTAWQCGLVRKI
jgi:hypothetical protein